MFQGHGICRRGGSECGGMSKGISRRVYTFSTIKETATVHIYTLISESLTHSCKVVMVSLFDYVPL